MIFKQSVQYRLSEREENRNKIVVVVENAFHIKPKQYIDSKYSLKI